MALSYKKLWKLLIDRDMNKTDLINLTGISQSTVAKLSKGENVNTEILDRICEKLKCDISDIVEFGEMEDENNGKSDN
jgi:DNA-binding Xre family transcriptional regulator